mgnify:FL=1
MFYKGRVGYAPTVSQALSQVGIDAKEAQDISIVDADGNTTDPKDGDKTDKAEGEDKPKPADSPNNKDSALKAIDDALRGIENARNGSFEEYGKALDNLDRAVKDYQNIQ